MLILFCKIRFTKMAKVVRLEICRKPSTLTDEMIQKLTLNFIGENPDLPIGRLISIEDKKAQCSESFCESVDSIIIHDEIGHSNAFKFFCYKLQEAVGEVEYCNTNDEEIEAGTHWILPCREFEGLYESLMFEDGVKERLLNLVETSVCFSQKKLNPIIINNNRLAIVYGPPGTGKTSFCKAIAQKLAIRMKQHFRNTHLIEINCHSLFSKWFSESGKLVQKMFQNIQELIENPKALVCVLVDEVESIAYSRSAISSSEPTDSLRVVNAVLTQLDRIRRFNNVLILTTSNVVSSLDEAFLDRADILQHIGLPTVEAIQNIYAQCLHELRRVGILQYFNDLPDVRDQIIEDTADGQQELVQEFLNLARISYGISGRNARKIPFIAHSLIAMEQSESIPLIDFLHTMRKAVEQFMNEKKAFEPIGNETENNYQELLEYPAEYLNEVQIENLQIVEEKNGYTPLVSNGNGF